MFIYTAQAAAKAEAELAWLNCYAGKKRREAEPGRLRIGAAAHVYIYGASRSECDTSLAWLNCHGGWQRYT